LRGIYVRQNPWTFFDPLGLKIESETKDREDGGKHTKITFRATLLDRSKGAKVEHENGTVTRIPRGKKQLEKLRDRMINELNSQFTKLEGDHTYVIDVDIQIYDSAKKVRKGDHHISIVEPELLHKKSGLDYGLKTPGGLANRIGGEQLLINNDRTYDFNTMIHGTTSDRFAQLAMHEFGHAAGLRHPHHETKSNGFDILNPLRNLGPGNFMSYDKNARNVHIKQIQQIQKKFDRKELNLPHIGWGGVSPPGNTCCPH